MTINTIPALKARTHFGEIMKRSFKNGEHFVVEKSGIPMIAIINAKEYEEYTRIMGSREEHFKIIDTIRKKAPNIPSHEIENDINEAITNVRKSKRA